MRVNAGRADPDEQVLAPADHLVDHLAGQIDGGKARHADIAAGQRATDQVPAAVCRGVPDGVTLGHGLPQPQPARGAGEPGVGRARPVRGADTSGPSTATPLIRSTRIELTRPAATSSASAAAAAWLAAGSSVKVSNDRPPRSRNHASSPSTSTTSAPAFRPGRARAVAVGCAGRPGQRRAVRVGRVGGGQHHRPVLGPFAGRRCRGSCAAGRPSRPRRTARRPATRRNSRAGSGRRPRTRSAPCRASRIRPVHPRLLPRPWSARRGG